jgi:hypothetical protein
MSDQSGGLAGDLLIGAAAIAEEIFGESDRPAQRRVYHLKKSIPVFQLETDSGSGGVLYAFRSKLREHMQAKSREQEARIAAAATMVRPTVPVVSPKRSPRRR